MYNVEYRFSLPLLSHKYIYLTLYHYFCATDFLSDMNNDITLGVADESWIAKLYVEWSDRCQVERGKLKSANVIAQMIGEVLPNMKVQVW